MESEANYTLACIFSKIIYITIYAYITPEDITLWIHIYMIQIDTQIELSSGLSFWTVMSEKLFGLCILKIRNIPKYLLTLANALFIYVI